MREVGAVSPSDENVATASKSAVIYLRVSTDRQARKGGEAEGYSIPAQRQACMQQAAQLGAVVVEEFVDAGASARSADRPQLQAMLARLEGRDIDYVIIHKVDGWRVTAPMMSASCWPFASAAPPWCQ